MLNVDGRDILTQGRKDIPENRYGITVRDLNKFKNKLDTIPVQTFSGMKVIENSMLEPMEVIIVVGSEYMKKIKLQEANGKNV